MQAVRESEQPVESQPALLTVSYEWIAYAVLMIFALVMRIADLDIVPLTSQEASQALAAWRTVHPDLPGSVIVPESPLLFLLHSVGFSILGGTEFAARVFTALGGTALVLAPSLFRDLLGRERAFILSLLLAFSPVLLVAARFDTPTTWALLAAVGGLWALRRWWLTSGTGYAILGSSLFAGLLLLTDPAGWWFALVLLVSGLIALIWNRIENPDSEASTNIRQRLRAWPWSQSLLAVVLTVFSVSTLFMFHLPGLAAVSQLLQTGLTGVFTPPVGAPPLFGLLTTFFYEPFMWIFALGALVLLARRADLPLYERFLVIWIVLAGAALLIYQGARPEHALWLIVPLTALASGGVIACLQPDEHPFLDIPWWGKPLVAVILFALLAIFTINAQTIARELLRTPDGSLVALQPNPLNVVWTVIVLLFIIVGYFLVGSLWGSTAALRGGALGLLAFALITSLGSGWNAAVFHADNPVEFWHTQATGRETALLRETLLELTKRESGGFPFLTVYAQAGDSGVIAWLLRDFEDVHYVVDPAEARAQEVVLMPASAEPPQLGGSYVGQNFVIARTWTPNTLLGFDLIPWWTQRRVRVGAVAQPDYVLWLRQDIYDGVELDLTQQ